VPKELFFSFLNAIWLAVFHGEPTGVPVANTVGQRPAPSNSPFCRLLPDVPDRRERKRTAPPWQIWQSDLRVLTATLVALDFGL